MQYRGIQYQTYVAVTTVCCTMLCASLNCERKSKENCLEDCQWSKVDKCIDCPDGFYGINCSRQCRYPNYGKDCQQDCSHCNREICNSTVGCLTQDGTIDRGTYELQRTIVCSKNIRNCQVIQISQWLSEFSSGFQLYWSLQLFLSLNQ